MMRKIIVVIIAIVVAILVYDYFLKPPSFKNGTDAPALSAPLINGNDFSLSSLKGNYVLLDFWGSWCAPCRKEMPELKKLYNSFHDKTYIDAENFHIVSVALEKSDAYTKRIIKTENLNWDYHIIDVSRVVMMSPLAQKFDVKEVPTKFFISPDGQIIGTNMSFEEMSEFLNDRVSS